MKLEWDRLAAWWQADVGDRVTRSIFDDGTTYRIFPSTHYFELWVWCGPAEDSSVLEGSGSDLRSQKRAKRLAMYDSLEDAMQGAEAFEATGRFAPKPRSHDPQPPPGQQGLF